MISKFATVYAGHVDLPDMGQMATPANERRYSNEHLATVFEKTEDVARAAPLAREGGHATHVPPAGRQQNSDHALRAGVRFRRGRESLPGRVYRLSCRERRAQLVTASTPGATITASPSRTSPMPASRSGPKRSPNASEEA